MNSTEMWARQHAAPHVLKGSFPWITCHKYKYKCPEGSCERRVQNLLKIIKRNWLGRRAVLDRDGIDDFLIVLISILAVWTIGNLISEQKYLKMSKTFLPKSLAKWERLGTVIMIAVGARDWTKLQCVYLLQISTFKCIPFGRRSVPWHLCNEW